MRNALSWPIVGRIGCFLALMMVSLVFPADAEEPKEESLTIENQVPRIVTYSVLQRFDVLGTVISGILPGNVQAAIVRDNLIMMPDLSTVAEEDRDAVRQGTEAECVNPQDYGAPAGLVSDGFESFPWLACPEGKVMRASIPTDTIRFKYKPWVGETKAMTMGVGIGDMSTFTPGETATTPIRALKSADKVCLYVVYNEIISERDIYHTIGCKFRPKPTDWVEVPPVQENRLCTSVSRCFSEAPAYTHAPFALTAPMIHCMYQMVSKMVSPEEGCEYKPLAFAQTTLYRAVMVALTLYVSILGIQFALQPQILGQKFMIFSFILKLILVIYFSVGFGKPSLTEPNNHGVTWIQQLSYGIASGVSSMFMRAAGDNGLCVLNDSDYPLEKAYLAVWDMIDCRVSAYIGMSNLSQPPDGVSIAQTPSLRVPIFIGMGIGWVVSLIIPVATIAYIAQPMFLVGCSILLMVFAIVQAVIQVAHVFMIALFAMSLLILMAPLMVPMVLFRSMNSYFEGWIKALLGYSLQPAIMVAYVGFMFAMFDQLFFGSCEFRWDTTSRANQGLEQFAQVTDGFPQVKRFYLRRLTKEQEQNPDYYECSRSLGYTFTYAKPTTSTASVFFFAVPFVSFGLLASEHFAYLCQQAGWIAFFSLFFYVLTTLVSGFAAGISGVRSLGEYAVSATALTDKLGQAVMTKAQETGDAIKENLKEKKKRDKKGQDGEEDGDSGGGDGNTQRRG